MSNTYWIIVIIIMLFIVLISIQYSLNKILSNTNRIITLLELLVNKNNV